MKKINKLLSVFLAAAVFSTALATLPINKKVEKVSAAGSIVHPGSAEIARSIADEGTVLLRNQGALPLKKSDRVALVGGNSMIYGGGGSGWVNTTEKISYEQGMRSAAAAGKIKAFDTKLFNRITDENKALYLISRETTENADRSRNSYYLSATEKAEISVLINSVGSENVIVLLNVGSVIDTTWLIEKNVGAIVVCYFGGSRAGESLASVLCGDLSPSGKTVDTWAKSLDDYPSESVGTFGKQNYTLYTEDVYVGYRWFETFDKNYEKVNYEFGFGLSYGKFELSERKAEVHDGKVIASAIVKNVGNFPAKEVLQAYYSAPQGEFGTPAKQLGGFAKTETLAPGQSRKIEIEFDVNDMAGDDDLGKISKNSTVLLKGEYAFYVGNSIRSAGANGVAGRFTVDKNRVIEKLSALPDSTLPSRLLANGKTETLAGEQTRAVGAIKVNALGATVIQAEDYADKSSSSSLEAYSSGTSIGKGIGNLNKNDGFLEYKLDVEKAGEYNILFAMATQYDNQIDMFTVTVNGVAQPVVASLATRTHDESDGQWYKCVPIKSETNKITLPAGECTLKFTSNGLKFQNIDFFAIYNENVGKGKAVITASAGSSSTGIIHGSDKFVTGYSGKAGNKYTFTVNAESAGLYDLSVLASNFTEASEKALSVSVGGEKCGYIPLSRTSVSGDMALADNKFDCVQSDSLVVTLEKGKNEIVLTSENSALGCLYSLNVEKTDGKALHTGNYKNNTADFAGVAPSMDGAKLEKVIMYNDVLFDNSLLDDFVSQLSVEELIYMHGTDAANKTGEINTGGVGGYRTSGKYGIPNAYTADGPAGIRVASSATWFPCMTMLASTWNAELAESFGRQVGFEASAVNVNVWLAPGVNIHRHPLCGRNFEYFSEDPLLAGKMGAAITRGAQSIGVSVCVKHYTTNNQENGRYVNDSRISNRALREIYLKPFEIVIKEGDAYAVMSSYNMCNGRYVAANRALITDVLRTDWGFKGAVFGDWNPSYPHIPLISSGNNFKSFNAEYSNLIAAYKSRIITREQLESNVKSTLKFLMLTDCNKQIVTYVGNGDSITAGSYAAEKADGETLSRMYRFYLGSDDEYNIEIIGTTDGLSASLDGNPVSAKIDKRALSFGVHTIIVSGKTQDVTAIEKIKVTAFSDSCEHNYGEWTEVRAATCADAGLKERACSICGKIQSEEIPATGNHAYENGICTVCGKMQPGGVHNHVFGEWQIDKAATCLVKGERHRVCACGAVEREQIPLAVHDYENGVCRVGGKAQPTTDGNNRSSSGNCTSSVNAASLVLPLGLLFAAAYVIRKRK